jgi:hypothetical protein
MSLLPLKGFSILSVIAAIHPPGIENILKFTHTKKEE